MMDKLLNFVSFVLDAPYWILKIFTGNLNLVQLVANPFLDKKKTIFDYLFIHLNFKINN